MNLKPILTISASHRPFILTEVFPMNPVLFVELTLVFTILTLAIIFLSPGKIWAEKIYADFADNVLCQTKGDGRNQLVLAG